MRFCFLPTENQNCVLPAQFWQRKADRSSCFANHTDTVILGNTRLVLHGRECAVMLLWLDQEAAVKCVALQVWKGGLTHPFLTPHFSIPSHLQGNTSNMLHFYITHRRQEFTHSAFAFSDVFRRRGDDFVLEASYLYVLTTICKLK